MTERIYDNKFLGDSGNQSHSILNQNTSLTRGSNLLANNSSATKQLQGDYQTHAKIKLQIGRKKMNISNSNQSRNEKTSVVGNQSNSYSQNIDALPYTVGNNHTTSNRTAKGPLNNMIGGQAIGGTQKMQFYINEGQASKKPRRLRKNFEMLTQGIKNSNTAKKDKKINFSSDSRPYSNTGQLIPQIYNQNYIADQSSPQVAANQYSQIDSIAQIYQYGAHIQQPFKDRKNSAYDVLVNPHNNQSQSQRVPSNHSNNSTQHNLSLYSHISIKENTPLKNQGNYSQAQSRNPSMMIYQNMPNNTQPIQVNDQKQYMKINDKLMRRYVMNDNQHIPIQGLQNLANSGSNSQAILNINTASDINIYNNSFIVNSSSKKLSHSQNQSRSNSVKRNQQPIALNNQNQRVIKPQQSIQRVLSQNSTNSNAMNSNSILQAQQNDYQAKYQQNKLTSSSGRINSQQRLVNQTSNSNINKTKNFNQIAEAYTTQTFFNNSGLSGSHVQQTSQNNQLIGVLSGTGSKSNIQHNKTQSSKILKKSQQNHTQSFDLQPFNTSTDQDIHNSSSQNFQMRNKYKFNSSSQNGSKRQKSMKQEDSYSKLEDQNFSPLINVAESNKKLMLSQSLLNQGKARLLEKDYQGAIKLFSEALNINPSLLDAKFYRGVSNLDSGQTLEAIKELQEILKTSPDHSQITHILLSIAFKRQNDIPEALSILNRCILKHFQYPDAYLARGQALLMQEQYEQALKDFQEYTKLMPTQGIGYVGAGDSQKSLKLWDESIASYTKAINLFQKLNSDDDQLKSHLLTTYLKRGLSFYYLRRNQSALSDLYKVTSQDPTQYKAHFYIGKILSRQYAVTPRLSSRSQVAQKIQNDAILHFEQVVKHQLNEIYAGNALFEIAKLRLRDKDFYEAYFNLKRAVDSNFTSKRLQLYKDFTEGVLYLIKRKIKKGVQILSDLLEVLVNSKEKKNKKQLESLKHQTYMYRAYGYVAIEKYEVALSDIKKAKKIAKLDAASVYNKLLGKGILRMDHEDYLMATKYFCKASLKFPLNKDPYCLYIISIVRSYTYSMADLTVDNESKKEKVMNAKIFMDSAIKNCNKIRIPSLFFFRGLLYFQLHMFYEALRDFNVAIEEEEEPTASYYLARGRCYACLSILTEAMKDLSIALNLDDSLQEAYIYRGKCAYLLGDNNLAFLDFQRLILTDPKNPMVHVYAGNLLMTTGAYQDAIKAFMNADTVQKTSVAAFQRARCFCALTDLENAKMQFKSALELCKNEFLVKIDSQCLSALMKVIASGNHSLVNKDKIIGDAIDIMNQLMQTFSSPKIQELEKKDAKLNIQIIPNVRRIKIEKVAVAKLLYASQSDQKEISISIDMTQSVDLEKLQNIPLYSYYYENVFQLEDFYLFRAVFNFYRKNFKEAISDYEYCRESRLNGNDGIEGLNIKTRGDVSPTQNNDHAESMMLYSRSSTPISMNSSKTDLSDVGLCSLNVHETNFNVLLCYLMMGDMQKSLEKLSDLIGQAPKKYQKYFFLIRALVYEKLGQNEKSQKDMLKLEKQEPKLYQQYFKENKEIFFEPFPIKNRLCSKFENVKLQFGGKRPAISTKPSFSMPFIKPPNMIPNIDEEVIQNEFTLKQIDAPMPEAPWIRRCEYGIKFTDDILQDDENDDYEQQQLDVSKELGQINKGKDGQQNTVKNQNAPLKGNNQRRDIKADQDESPYTQSAENNTQIAQDKKAAYHKGISERIIKNATVYLMDHEDEDQLSDKHKISLFDDSKFEEQTIDNYQGKSLTQGVQGVKHRTADNRDSLDQVDELMQQHLLMASKSSDEDDDDDSSNDDDENGATHSGVVYDRDSMVLVGENVIRGIKKKKTQNKSQGNRSNVMLISSDDEDKQKILSELESNIDIEDDLNQNERDSIFRSKQSSKR